MKILRQLRTYVVLGWSVLRDFVQVLRPCRFSALIVLTAALLLIADQGQELTRRLGGEGASLRETVLFFVCVLAWAFQSWYWARLMLDVAFGLDRSVSFADAARQKRVGWMIRSVPRLLAFAAFLIAAAALLFSSSWWLAATAVAMGIAFYFALVRRQEWLKKYIPARFGRFFAPPEGITRYEALKQLPRASHIVLGITAAIVVAATVWVWADPAAFGAWFGAAAAAFFGFSCIVPGGSLLVFWSHRGGPAATERELGWGPVQESFPIVTLLLVAAVIFGIWVDNHAVRLAHSAGSSSPVSVAGRPDLNKALYAWHEGLPERARSSAPLIVVATAGGGSRAAYWTATVLGAMQDANPDFSRHLFAISGVSGGSLGATVYRTLLAAPSGAWPTCREDIPGVARGPFECGGQQFLSRDFLAPLVGALLFPDLMQRFIPVSLMPDRAEALEKGWEQAWPAAGFGPDTWRGRAFTSLFTSTASTGGTVLPALLLNGTHVDTGKRIITSSIQVDNSVFLDAYDFFDLVGGDVWISTAVLNSARFPYVAPAGTMRRDKKHNGQIVDGGYFENFGALTALQLMRAARQTLRETHPKQGIQPIFIQISSDPELSRTDLPDSDAPKPEPKPGSPYLNEVLSPLRAIFNTRTARGVLAAKQLFEKEPGVQAFHFRLCQIEGQRDPALGWVMSTSAEAEIRTGLHRNECGNDAAFARLKKVLAGYSASTN